jgi:hypothetical protein
LNKKHLFITIAVTTGVLFLIGFFFISSRLLSYVESSMGFPVVYNSLSEALEFKLSIGALLALCALAGLLIDWIYSIRRSSRIHVVGFFISLIIPLAGLFVGFWLRISFTKGILLTSMISVPKARTVLPLHAINFFKWGLGSLIVVCILVIVLIFVSKKSLKKTEISKHDALSSRV